MAWPAIASRKAPGIDEFCEGSAGACSSHTLIRFCCDGFAEESPFGTAARFLDSLGCMMKFSRDRGETGIGLKQKQQGRAGEIEFGTG
jgi:hypothetical protein